MSYALEGRLLEACSCKAICPCWVGEDPDGGRCSGTIAWRVDRGEVNGTDVSGLTLGIIADIPGNATAGNWRVALFVDDRATAEQEAALLAVFTGKEGGPLADIAGLVGEVVSIERALIEAEVEAGHGVLRIGEVMSADFNGFVGRGGEPTRLHDGVFSFKPGAPAFPGKAGRFKVDLPSLGMRLELEAHSTVQGHFAFST
jgi:hypothetical protein